MLILWNPQLDITGTGISDLLMNGKFGAVGAGAAAATSNGSTATSVSVSFPAVDSSFIVLSENNTW